MLLKETYMEGCMLLEGNVQVHGIYILMTADLFVEVHTCTFKIVRQPTILGAVSQHTMFTLLDQQLQQMDSETLPGWDSSLNKESVQKDVVALTTAAAMLHLHRQLDREQKNNTH
jgi:hypothetical protein